MRVAIIAELSDSLPDYGFYIIHPDFDAYTIGHVHNDEWYRIGSLVFIECQVILNMLSGRYMIYDLTDPFFSLPSIIMEIKHHDNFEGMSCHHPIF